MTESQKTSVSVKARFFMRMFVATFCAWAIPHIAYRFMQLNSGAISLTFTLNGLFLFFIGLALVSGFGTGLVISIMQWIALRPYIQSTWRWLVGLILAWVLGDIINTIFLVVTIKAFPGWSHEQFVLIRMAVYSLSVGIPAGLIQQALLQKRSGIQVWWAVSTLLGIVSAIAVDRGNLTLREGYAIIDPIYASLLAGVMMATLSSLPTLLLRPVEEAGRNSFAAGTEPTNSTHIENNLT